MRPSVAILFALWSLTLGALGRPGEASAEQTSSTVRSESPLVRSAIAQATERSATFRTLLESIASTDGVIYIIEGQCPRRVPACLLMSIGGAGPNRFLRIVVNPRWSSGCRLVESIAHELQHALEALTHKSVRTSESLYLLFERIGPTASGTFETQAALNMGRAVEREACGKN